MADTACRCVVLVCIAVSSILSKSDVHCVDQVRIVQWGEMVDGDAARDQVGDVLFGLRDQLADIAAMEKKQTELKVDGKAADDTVQVTVNARGQVVKTTIDKSYLDDHEFEELGDHITEAAQAAAAEAGRRVAEMLAPINARHGKLPSLSDIVDSMPDLSDVIPQGLEIFGLGSRRQKDPLVSSDAKYDEGDGQGEFPAVRR
jgi:DNA-binding protein YbaB